jgi:hypothetical protein
VMLGTPRLATNAAEGFSPRTDKAQQIQQLVPASSGAVEIRVHTDRRQWWVSLRIHTGKLLSLLLLRQLALDSLPYNGR